MAHSNKRAMYAPAKRRRKHIMNQPITEAITSTAYRPLYTYTTLEQAFEKWENSTVTVSLYLNEGLEGRQHLLSFEAEFDETPYQVIESNDEDEGAAVEQHSIQYYTNDELFTLDLPDQYVIFEGTKANRKMVQIRTIRHVIEIMKGGN